MDAWSPEIHLFYKLLPLSAGECHQQRREEMEALDQPYDSFVFPSPPVHQEVADSLPSADESRDDAHVPEPTPVDEMPEVMTKTYPGRSQNKPSYLVLKDHKSLLYGSNLETCGQC